MTNKSQNIILNSGFFQAKVNLEAINAFNCLCYLMNLVIIYQTIHNSF
jgi:hypothetical protein